MLANPNAIASLESYHVTNVRVYGATGNGVTDDTAAIASAITAAGVGGLLYFPPGTFLISSALTPLAGQTWMGAGRKISYLSVAGVSVAAAITISVDAVIIQDLGILGNDGKGAISGTTSAIGIYASGATNLLIDRCYCDNKNKWGILIQDSSDKGYIQNCLLDGTAYANTIEVNTSTHVTVYGNIILGSHVGTNANEIELYNCSDVLVIGNTLTNSNYAGIQSFGAIEPRIIGNSITHCKYGVYLYWYDLDTSVLTDKAVVMGNYIDTMTNVGILLQLGSTHCTVTDNIVTNCSQAGIASYAPYCTIQNNICRANPFGIYLGDTGDHNAVISNVCENSQYHGIDVEPSYCVLAYNRCTDTRAGGAKTQQYGIQTETTAHYTIIQGNQCDGNSVGTILDQGSSNQASNNPGYNPLAITAPAVPSSTVAYTNAFNADATVIVTGGTVTVIKIGAVTTGLTSGTFRVPVGQTITITYSSVPTWKWFGD